MRKFILFLYAMTLIISLSVCTSQIQYNNNSGEDKRLSLHEIYAQRKEIEGGRQLRTFQNVDESESEQQPQEQQNNDANAENASVEDTPEARSRKRRAIFARRSRGRD